MSYTMNSNCCCPGGGLSGSGIFSSRTGFGATSSIRQTFSCEQVWADAQAGGAVGEALAFLQNHCKPAASPANEVLCAHYQQQVSNANFRGLKAADATRAGLNELGYGPLTLGVAWGGADSAAWAAFTSDQGLPAGPGLVNKAGLCRMEEMLRGNETGKAGFGKAGLIALAVAGVVGVGALLAGKKKKGQTAGFGAA